MVPLPVGDNAKLEIGLSFGEGLGYSAESTPITNKLSRYKSSADFGPWHLGLEGDEEIPELMR